MKKMLFLVAVGAALAYFLDPDNGVKRRDAAKAKLNSYGTPASTGSSSSS